MFQFVTSLMNQGYQEESARQRQLALSPKERPDKRNTALWDSTSFKRHTDCYHQYSTKMQFVNSVLTVMFSVLLTFGPLVFQQTKTSCDCLESTLFLNLNSAAVLLYESRTLVSWWDKHKWVETFSGCSQTCFVIVINKKRHLNYSQYSSLYL